VPHATAEHPVPSIPVEGDGISYSGLFWFGVILTITTVICAAIVWGLFEFWERREIRNDAVRAPLAAPRANPTIDRLGGRIDQGTAAAVMQPGLLVDEPAYLRQFRTREDEMLRSWGWVDRNAGTVHMPIDRAMDLLIERGLPVRGQTPPQTKEGTEVGKDQSDLRPLRDPR
jgi:hypothetical protein